MLCAETIANCLILLASQEDEFEPMTHLRLQKLLYYVQGWSLAMRGNPAFGEEVQAWREGPVVSPVYQVFKEFEARPIGREHMTEEPQLDREIEGFIRSIWEAYKKYSATELRRKTHTEAPWLKARGDTPPNGSSNNEITHDSMLRFFAEEFRREQFGDLSIERYRQSEEAFRAQRGKRFSDICLATA